jgi:HAE1 family hydrophobic/amphiphilic exporter-1
VRIVQESIRSPVTTTVGVILLVLFGSIALFRLPVQLTPEVEQPQVSVSTSWPGASPAEVEREIVEEQEEQLKSLQGLVEMESSCSDGSGRITLTFSTGTDTEAALIRVSNRLEQVPRYPDDADKPVIRSVGTDRRAIAWFPVVPGGEKPFQGDISTLFNFIEDFVKPEFERVPGVAEVNIYGGREREMQVVVDPEALAARRITMNELARALDSENRNYSGGDFSEGKRRYIVRTVGEYASPEEVEAVVVAVRNGVPVFVRDVARAELGHRKPRARTYYMGQRMIVLNAVKEPGANVLEVMKGLRASVEEVNRELLSPRGLVIIQSFDETDYIYSAIRLVLQSLLVGGVLAVTVLLLFLRSRTSTLVVAVAIPISVIGSFLMMSWFGRSLNVISLAGMAFAVGMVVDNSIVVLENIYRHRQMGKARREAAYEGAREVWGAVLASTLTTIAVFVPVLFVEEEAGQLFRDIAIAISCAVGLSLLVAITVIPSMSARVLQAAESGGAQGGFHDLWGLVPRVGALADWISAAVSWVLGGVTRRLALVVLATAVALGLSWLLLPEAEYLPVGNQNFVFGIVQPPPGYNIDEVTAIHDRYRDGLSYLWERPEAESADLPGGGIRNFFFVALTDRIFMGARSRDPSRVRELLPIFEELNTSVPGAFGFISQVSLFQRGLGEGRNIDVEVSGPDLERLVALGGEIYGRTKGLLPEAQIRPIPGLDLANPEVRVHIHRQRAAELGITNRDLGFIVSALVDGAKASDYQDRGDEIDLRVMARESEEHRTHRLEQMSLVTPAGDLVTLGSLAEIEVTGGPVQIRRRERQRDITIQVTPPERVPLQAAMETIENEVLDSMREQGRLGGLYRVELSGTADKLTQTGRALRWNLLLALVITYLLMAALFESFLYPLVIMFSVPMAALGGFLGLAFVNTVMIYQPLDVLTMLGFIILIGTVVNNAILIVHQSLNHMRQEGQAPAAAIPRAVRNRVRPIFMSVLTSTCGMAPLVLFPGAGSELYRGLGSVVVGGLLVSTVFTLFLVPALFSLVLDAREAVRRRVRRLGAPAGRGPA